MDRMMAKPLPDPGLPWAIPLEAVQVIADAEGLRLKAYRCPAGVLTCGWGETQGISATTVWTKEEADRRLCGSIDEYASQVKALCTDEPTVYELGAMVSLAYNIGVDAFAKSTVLAAHNRNDPQSASRAFGFWNKARVNGVVQELPGLTARRAIESALYLRQSDEVQVRMPQAVESESTLKTSPIAVTSTASATVGALSLLSEAGNQLGVFGKFAGQAKSVFVETFGLSASVFLPTVLVVVGGVILWQRYGQRIRGWA